MSGDGASLAGLEAPEWAAAFRFAAEPSLACPHVTGHPIAGKSCERAVPLEGFGRADVAETFALCAGEPHRREWLGVFRLHDGRFACLRAWCCGRGFDCHADGRAHVARSLADLVRYGLTEAEARRAGLGW
jgi:hypothetical protein